MKKPRTTRRTSSTQPQRLDTIRAAKFVGLSKRTLEKWRYEGGGPPYLKLGRRVLYSLGDLEEWIGRQRRSSTSEH